MAASQGLRFSATEIASVVVAINFGRARAHFSDGAFLGNEIVGLGES
jgi:hypothetical protein